MAGHDCILTQPLRDNRQVTEGTATEETRIDRWLCAVRLVKTRPIATQLCDGGQSAVVRYSIGVGVAFERD
jgi:hypothetical protein